jgi:hypothetical protein
MAKNEKSFEGSAIKALLALLLIGIVVLVYGYSHKGAAQTEVAVDTLSAAGVGGGSTGTLVTYGMVEWIAGSQPPVGTSGGAPPCPTGWVESYAGYGPFLFAQSESDPGSKWMTLGSIDICIKSNTSRMYMSNVSLPGSDNSFVFASIDPCYYWQPYDDNGDKTNKHTCNQCRVCVPESSLITDAIQPESGSTIIYAAMKNYTGNFGSRANADSICRTKAPAGLSAHAAVASAKAFISVSTADEIRDLPNIDMDGDTKIGNFKSNLPVYGYSKWGIYTKLSKNWNDLLDGSIFNSIANTVVADENPSWECCSTYPARPLDYWTGSEVNGQLSTYSCSGWTLASGIARIGCADNMGTGWLECYVDSCNVERPLLCAAMYN